ncbi:hypothetical protein SAMN05877753_102684 [Bacillus oleivorans]|uniref:Rhodanese-related sulfurtransferase n=1 Tax=Bacillus oleivorans TaxID=1448271 RepID=A0A285CNT0_9BACI|nr:hypothetical protein [Bacillus oleivorans]SNX68708.1 hypothetical protein SAMN05877753_102684 [Bacillus oleivorans]
MTYLVMLLAGLISFKLYNRYVPIFGVKCSAALDLNETSIQVIDVRDYNQSYKDPVHGAVNIPIAYLKRYHRELNSHKIYIIASSPLEKNLSIRFLKRRGFKIIGYRLTNCNCKEWFKRKLA